VAGFGLFTKNHWGGEGERAPEIRRSKNSAPLGLRDGIQSGEITVGEEIFLKLDALHTMHFCVEIGCKSIFCFVCDTS
jgi:hypothetical protein